MTPSGRWAGRPIEDVKSPCMANIGHRLYGGGRPSEDVKSPCTTKIGPPVFRDPLSATEICSQGIAHPVTFQANCPSLRGYKIRRAFVFKTTIAGSIRATRHDKDCIRSTTTALGGADTVTKRLQRRRAQSGQLPNWRASPVPRRGPTGQMNAKPSAVPQRVTLSFPS